MRGSIPATSCSGKPFLFLLQVCFVLVPKPHNLQKDLIIKSGVCSEPVFLNVHGAQESIPRNEFRQHM